MHIFYECMTVIFMCKYNKNMSSQTAALTLINCRKKRFDLCRLQQIRQIQLTTYIHTYICRCMPVMIKYVSMYVFRKKKTVTAKRRNCRCRLLVDIKFDLPIDKLPIFTAKIPLIVRTKCAFV